MQLVAASEKLSRNAMAERNFKIHLCGPFNWLGGLRFPLNLPNTDGLTTTSGRSKLSPFDHQRL